MATTDTYYRLLTAVNTLFMLAFLGLEAWLLYVCLGHRRLSPPMRLVVIGAAGDLVTTAIGRVVPVLIGYMVESTLRILIYYGIQMAFGAVFRVLFIYGLAQVFLDVRRRLARYEKPEPSATGLD